MAQAVRHDEVELESLLSQAKEKALLLQKDANGQKGNIYAEPEGWIIEPLCAVLIGCRELRVYGEYPTQKLAKKFYGVSFEVMLTNKCNIDEVELTLTLPDGSVQTHKESLKKYPRNVPISLIAGAFFNSFKSGNITFELKGTERETLKKGLVIFGVLINPLPFKADA